MQIDIDSEKDAQAKDIRPMEPLVAEKMVVNVRPGRLS